MTKKITRTKGYKELSFKIKNKIITLKNNQFFKQYGVDGIIRFHKADYDLIKNHGPLLTHFNLQICDNKKNHLYALVRIERPGYYDGKKEINPILSFQGLTAKCIQIKDNLPYNKLTKEDFKYSFYYIKSIPKLKAEILKRYKYSMYHLSNKEKLKLGVSLTKLKILDAKSLLKNRITDIPVNCDHE